MWDWLDGELPIYRLTLDGIRHLSEEELTEKRHAAEEVRRASYRAIKDGTLELCWAGGKSTLEPQVLLDRSVSNST